MDNVYFVKRKIDGEVYAVRDTGETTREVTHNSNRRERNSKWTEYDLVSFFQAFEPMHDLP